MHVILNKKRSCRQLIALFTIWFSAVVLFKQSENRSSYLKLLYTTCMCLAMKNKPKWRSEVFVLTSLWYNPQYKQNTVQNCFKNIFSLSLLTLLVHNISGQGKISHLNDFKMFLFKALPFLTKVYILDRSWDPREKSAALIRIV